MKLSENLINSYIDSKVESILSAQYQGLGDLLVTEKHILIGGKKYILDIWQETWGDKIIFIVEVSEKLFFLKKVYAKGVLFGDGENKVISQEEMWDLGLG